MWRDPEQSPIVTSPPQQLQSLAWTATPTAAPPPYLIALTIRLEIARRNASGRANIVVIRSPASVTAPPVSEAFSQTASTEGSVGIRGSHLVSGGQTASFSRAPALIIAAPLSAIMIVGALVFVELTAGITEASTTRSASRPWTRSWSSTTAIP